MKFTLSWLKDHLETEASLEDILYALTDLGLEVEGVEDPSRKLAAFTPTPTGCACAGCAPPRAKGRSSAARRTRDRGSRW